MSQNVPKCPQMSPNVLKCPQMSPNAPKCHQISAKYPANVSKMSTKNQQKIPALSPLSKFNRYVVPGQISDFFRYVLVQIKTSKFVFQIN